MNGLEMEQLSVVLCRVESAGNVGAICRAMATMGCRRLILAACPDYDEVGVRTWALNAWDIYAAAERYPDLPSALRTCSYAAAFSRRSGRKRKEALDLRDWSGWLIQGGGRPVALVFGNERDGLDSVELACCDDAVFIPTDAAQPSLNVSHAVQLVCWELRRHLLQATVDGRSPPQDRLTLDLRIQILVERLSANGFFKLAGRDDTGQFLREIAARAGLSSAEMLRFADLLGKSAVLASKKMDTDLNQP